MKKVLFIGFCLAASVLSAYETNWWQAVDSDYGGRWGDEAHWSLGHVPTGEELTVIDPVRNKSTVAAFSIDVDGAYTNGALIVGDPGNVQRKISVTFTGDGSITSLGISQSIFRYCTAVTFDGPSITFKGSRVSVLNYAPLTVKNGSTFYSEAGMTFWKNNDNLTVDSGGTVNVASITYNNGGDRTITVNDGGTFVCRGTYAPYKDSESATQQFDLVINGGDVQVGELKLTRPTATVTMTGGSLRLESKPTVASEDMSQFRISGGALYYGFDLLQDASDPYYVLAGERLGGCNVFSLTNGTKFVSHSDFHVSQLRIADSEIPAYIDCDELVFDGKNWPFKWTYKRNFHLYGPTDIYVEGSNLGGFNNHYLWCHGKFTVHTEDWSDPTIKRTVAIRGFNSADGSLDLVAKGGGTFKFGQSYSYRTMRSFTVEEGTALQLGDRDAKIGNTTEWGPLVAETLTLGKDVTVAFTAGEQHISASTWNIDPSVQITVTIPEKYTNQNVDFPKGGFPILQDLDSKALPDSLLSQITLAGKPEGWELVNEYGQISVVQLDKTLLGTLGDFEWLGSSGDNNWTTIANWNGGTPVEYTNHYFGVSENRLVNFDHAIAATRKGTTLRSITFDKCAGRSFFIYGGSQATFHDSTTVKSYSLVPQVLAIGHRSAAKTSKEIASYSGGPLIFSGQTYGGKAAYGFASKLHNITNNIVEFLGDVRIGCEIAAKSSIPGMTLDVNRTQFPSYRTCLTVLDGGDLNFVTQAVEFAYANTSFRVSEGGTLSFAESQDAFYEWSQAPAPIIINGTLTIGPVWRGGCDQTYCGSGTINVNGGDLPYKASSRVKFADSLTVNLASDWQTAVSGSESIALALGVTAGAPTLRVPTSWTYGAANGVTAASTADERAFALENCAKAVIDPQGGTATLNEAVTGEGTLEIANGTLVMNATSTAADATVSVGGNAALQINADQRLAGLSLATGATAVVSSAVTVDALKASGAAIDLGTERTLTVLGDVNVQDVEFVFGLTPKVRRTLVRAKGVIVGTPSNAGRFIYRTKRVGDETLLQAGNYGLMFFVR